MRKTGAWILIMALCVTELPFHALSVRAEAAAVSGNSQSDEEAFESEAVSVSGDGIQEEADFPKAGDAGVSGNETGTGGQDEDETQDGQTVEAPQAAVLSSVRADTYQSITLIYEAVSNAAGYEIYRGEKSDESDMALLTVIEGNTNHTFTDRGADNLGLKTGTAYYYKVRAYVLSAASEKVYGGFSAVLSAVPSLEQVQGVSAASESYRSIALTWSSVTGADGYDIYFCASAGGAYTLAGSVTGKETTKFSHNSSSLAVGRQYYYKVCAYRNVAGVKVSSPASAVVSAKTVLSPASLTAVKRVNYKTLQITYKRVEGADGYEIYRSKKANKGFKKIGTVTKGKTLTYKDKKCSLGVTYYYKVRAYRKVSGKKVYAEYSKVKKGNTTLSKPKQKKAQLLSVDTAQISWNKVDGAKGYEIYRSLTQNGKYKKVNTIKGGKVTSCEIAGQENGNTYYYKIRAYYTKGGKKKYSSYSNVKSVLFNVYGYENESYEDRAKRIFGTSYYQKYGSKEEAAANMKTIAVPVWDFNANKTAKVTKYRSLTVHKNIAPTVQQIFKEIYEGKEQFPIKSVGAFSWRGDTSNSEHNQGLAIDINPEENYMIDGDTILSGKYWKPGEDPYSIPSDGEVVKIMRKYGFFQGIWGDRRDYMHFSYFGT
ncbi:MAG: M15 family metallopeptidase [Lachnospiraceae bacterium]|nr:M15 family metallopeptidase [Lachnospiraceae bacterium]